MFAFSDFVFKRRGQFSEVVCQHWLEVTRGVGWDQ